MYRTRMGVAERGTILLGGSSEAPNSGMARPPACRTFAVGAVVWATPPGRGTRGDDGLDPGCHKTSQCALLRGRGGC